jgi:hypothetical protein
VRAIEEATQADAAFAAALHRVLDEIREADVQASPSHPGANEAATGALFSEPSGQASVSGRFVASLSGAVADDVPSGEYPNVDLGPAEYASYPASPYPDPYTDPSGGYRVVDYGTADYAADSPAESRYDGPYAGPSDDYPSADYGSAGYGYGRYPASDDTSDEVPAAPGRGRPESSDKAALRPAQSRSRRRRKRDDDGLPSAGRGAIGPYPNTRR